MTDEEELLPDSLRWPRRSSLVTFVSGALTFALVWGQHHWQVLHPHYLPFVILITLMTVAAAVALGSGLWRVIRGPFRLWALAWMVLALIPLVFFGFVGLYAMVEWRERRVPNNLPMNLAKVMGVTLMRLEAAFDYPHRLETERLVMFYDRPRSSRRRCRSYGSAPCRNGNDVGRIAEGESLLDTRSVAETWIEWTEHSRACLGKQHEPC